MVFDRTLATSTIEYSSASAPKSGGFFLPGDVANLFAKVDGEKCHTKCGTYLLREKLPGLGILIATERDEVAAIRIWDDLKQLMDPEAFKKMEYKGIRAGPYLPIAMYVKHTWPDGPFCMPLHFWNIEANNIAIENFIDERFWMVDFLKMLRETRDLLHPNGY